MSLSYFIVFGATGNLMYKKLWPALDQLQKNHKLSDDFRILCIGRRPYSTDDYIEEAKKEVKLALDWDHLSSITTYYQMQLDDLSAYQQLAVLTKNASMKLVYLAVGPELFAQIAHLIHESSLIAKGEANGRIVFEKPFGEDLASAKAINTELWNYFDESQLFRIDHYLGKEMIQNILVMRFANKLFESNWNNSAISSVTILAKETEGVMNRGPYYNRAGALKDMVQSHLLQMVALIAMDVPTQFDNDGIRHEKVKIMKQLRLSENGLLRGQYLNYTRESSIPSDSQTETAVMMECEIDHPRWKGVPFYIFTGKKLNEKRSEIIIDFKENSEQHLLWPTQHPRTNRLVIRVAPEEGVTFTLNVKEHGLSSKILPMAMDYCHGCDVVGNKPEAYERLLLDFIQGTSTLFTRWDEIEASWTFIDEIKKHQPPLFIYDQPSTLFTAINHQFKEVPHETL